MRPKITPRAVTQSVEHASQADRVPRALRSFTSSFLFGLSAAGLFLAGRLPTPKAPPEGIRSDWEAIGRDLGSALRNRG